MSDTISEAAKVKACELLNASCGRVDYVLPRNANDAELFAFALFIQQVSDACREQVRMYGADSDLNPFILNDPVDPLIEERDHIVASYAYTYDGLREAVHAALKRGMELAK